MVYYEYRIITQEIFLEIGKLRFVAFKYLISIILSITIFTGGR